MTHPCCQPKSGLGSDVALTTHGFENGAGVDVDNVDHARVWRSQVDLDRVEGRC